MKKKILLSLLVFISILTLVVGVLFYRIDWTVKLAINIAGGNVDKVERIEVGNWRIHNLSFPIDEKNSLTIKETEIDFLEINASKNIINNYLQALHSKINIKAHTIEVMGFKIKQASCLILKELGASLQIKNIHITDFGKRNKGHVVIDLASFESIKADYRDINLDYLIKYFDASLGLSGHINIEASMLGSNIDARVYGNNLMLKGFRVDDVISNFLDTRSIGLMDAAAFVALGPIGLLYTTGASLGQTLGGFRGGETPLKKVNVAVNLRGDIVSLEDVGVATKNNLVVAQGGANIKEQKFKDLLVSILDDDYCPQLQQAIKGTFQKPEISKTKAFLDTASAPVESLKNSTFQFIGVDTCKRSYKGIVKHPDDD